MFEVISLLVGFNEGLFLYKESYQGFSKKKTLSIEVLYDIEDADNEWYNIYKGKKRDDNIFIDRESLINYVAGKYGTEAITMIERFMKRDMKDELKRVVLWRGI